MTLVECYMIRDRETISNRDQEDSERAVAALAVHTPKRSMSFSERPVYNTDVLAAFCKAHPRINFIVMQWLDLLGTLRCRMQSVDSFANMINSGSRMGISKGNLGTLQNDHLSDVCDPVGQILVKPDLVSLREMWTSSQGSGQPRFATVLAGFDDEDGQPLSLCPRSQLQSFVDALEKEYGVSMLVGFEIEIIFCELVDPGQNHVDRPLDTNHAWGTFTDEQLQKAYPLIAEIATALKTIGIELQHFHSESGAGQYEFVLPPRPAVEAVDTLVQAKQCIQHIVASKHLRATCHPTPFPGIGTAAHAHISLNTSPHNKTTAELEKLEMSFVSAVLAHLPALCAFTMPQSCSYGRVVDDSWTGGTWVAWGTQNRETPLRRVGRVDGEQGKGSRWEVRCLDGTANMYLALAAVVGCGLSGVRDDLEMGLGDCRAIPAKLSQEEKEKLGIVMKLPTSIDQAIEELERDEKLAEAVGQELVRHYVVMKKAEQAMLNEMDEEVRRVWLMERY